MKHTINVKTNLKDITLTLGISDIRVLKRQLRFPLLQLESVMENLLGLRKLLV